MIFGLEQPQIKIGEEILLLNNSNLEPEFMKPIYIEYTSPLNGEKTFIYLGDYASFKIQVNAFDIDDSEFLFQQLKKIEGELVVFYPHKDEQAIKDKFGNDVLFYISAVEPYYLNNDSQFDIIQIELLSVGFVDYSGIYNIHGYGYQFAHNFGYGV
ncbi:MAG: hypothetical protein KGZ42_07600 [Melioribacter sp.]|nr:hypothetical protein [Melioribacter sp.]